MQMMTDGRTSDGSGPSSMRMTNDPPQRTIADLGHVVLSGSETTIQVGAIGWDLPSREAANSLRVNRTLWEATKHKLLYACR